MGEVVPEPVRVNGHPRMLSATGDHPVDAVGSERPAAVDPEPQLGPMPGGAGIDGLVGPPAGGEEDADAGEAVGIGVMAQVREG
jgi:hypothetical protein